MGTFEEMMSEARERYHAENERAINSQPPAIKGMPEKFEPEPAIKGLPEKQEEQPAITGLKNGKSRLL